MAISLGNYNISTDTGQDKMMAICMENYDITSDTRQDKTE